MSKLLIKGGTVVFADRHEICDILIEDKKIIKIAKMLKIKRLKLSMRADCMYSPV